MRAGMAYRCRAYSGTKRNARQARKVGETDNTFRVDRLNREDCESRMECAWIPNMGFRLTRAPFFRTPLPPRK